MQHWASGFIEGQIHKIQLMYTRILRQEGYLELRANKHMRIPCSAEMLGSLNSRECVPGHTDIGDTYAKTYNTARNE